MSADAVKASYARAFAAYGVEVVVRRYTGTGADRPRTDAKVLARVLGYEPRELVGAIKEGDRKVIVLHEDLVTKQFPVPLVRGDKVVVAGRELNVEAPDGDTRRVGTQTIAWELQVRG
jgi:chemotaxis receptor (MCP) glutamine deamidase CheD